MKSLLTAAIAATVAGSASAGSTFTDVQMDEFSGIPNFSGAFTFDQFDAADFGDPQFVQLCSVKITLEVDINGGILQLDNDGVDPAVVTGEIGALVTMNSMDIFGVSLSAQPLTQGMFNLAANNGDGPTFDNEPGDPDYAELNGTGQSDMDMAFFDSGAFLTQFEGAGMFDLDYVATQIFNNGGVGGVSFGGTPVNATVKATVEYEYKIVPTPASAALFGLGGFVAARRRR